ncbi:MAG TPA: hypothetical protein PLZ95_16985 [Bryobacteraceae bacterium]|nr:hypothetical protein [Bryobacteraceae bacterium]
MSLHRRDLLAAGAALALPACRSVKLPASLVPDLPCPTPSYWTTLGVERFGASNAAQWMAAASQAGAAADRLGEANLFGPQGWAHAFKAVHADLFLVADLGWDLDPGQWTERATGTLTVSEAKFPSCTGAPAERLAKLAEKVKLLGWRGLGVRVATQAHWSGTGSAYGVPEQFFRSQLRLAHQLGVRYWKVESPLGTDIGLRRMLSVNAAGEAPDLAIENSSGWGPLNSPGTGPDRVSVGEPGRFRTWDQGRKLDAALEMIAFSRVFRAGETTAHLSIPTTLDRVANLLLRAGGDRGNDCLLNCGDEVYMAAALGCTMGVERHPGWTDPALKGYDPRLLRYRMTEVIRAIRWQRIAPPWPVGYTKTELAAERLADDWPVNGDGVAVAQGAPARVARNGPMPKVTATGSVPYVVAAVHPNGAAAVAALPRMFAGRGHVFPEANVTLEVDDPMRPIGVFGRFQSLTLDLVAPPAEVRVLAQDLAADEAVDVTERVSLAGSTMVIPGDLINRIGQSVATRNDQSDPGLVLQIFRG